MAENSPCSLINRALPLPRSTSRILSNTQRSVCEFSETHKVCFDSRKTTRKKFYFVKHSKDPSRPQLQLTFCRVAKIFIYLSCALVATMNQNLKGQFTQNTKMTIMKIIICSGQSGPVGWITTIKARLKLLTKEMAQSSSCKLKIGFISNRTHPCLVKHTQRFCCHSRTWSGMTSHLWWLMLEHFT